jgi:hypothetical protein
MSPLFILREFSRPKRTRVKARRAPAPPDLRDMGSLGIGIRASQVSQLQRDLVHPGSILPKRLLSLVDWHVVTGVFWAHVFRARADQAIVV